MKIFREIRRVRHPATFDFELLNFCMNQKRFQNLISRPPIRMHLEEDELDHEIHWEEEARARCDRLYVRPKIEFEWKPILGDGYEVAMHCLYKCMDTFEEWPRRIRFKGPCASDKLLESFEFTNLAEVNGWVTSAFRQSIGKYSISTSLFSYTRPKLAITNTYKGEGTGDYATNVVNRMEYRKRIRI